MGTATSREWHRSIACYKTGDYGLALQSSMLVLQHGRSTNDRPTIADAAFMVGRCQFKLGRADLAVHFLKEARESAYTFPPTQLVEFDCNILYWLGLIHYNSGEAALAKDYMEQSRQVCLKKPLKHHEIECMFWLGRIADDLNLIQDAISLFEECIRKFDVISPPSENRESFIGSDPIALYQVWFQLGKAQYHGASYNDAIISFKKSLFEFTGTSLDRVINASHRVDVLHDGASSSQYSLTDNTSDVNAPLYEMDHLIQAATLTCFVKDISSADIIYWIGLCYYSMSSFAYSIMFFSASYDGYKNINLDRFGKGAGTLFWLGLSYFGSGNDEKAQQLLEMNLDILLKDCPNRNDEAETFFWLGKVYRRRGRYLQSTDALEKSLLIYRDVGKILDAAGVLFLLGRGYYDLMDDVRAGAYLMQALQITVESMKQRGTLLQGKVLYWLGKVFSRRKSYDDALLCLLKCLHIYASRGKSKSEVGVLLEIAFVYNFKKQYVLSIEYFKKCEIAAEGVSDVKMQYKALLWLGKVSRCLGMLTDADGYLEKCLSLPSNEITVDVLFLRGRILFEINNFDLSLKYFHETALLLDSQENKHAWSFRKLNVILILWIGLVYFKLQLMTEAIHYVMKAITLSRELALKEEDRFYCECLYWLGRAKLALRLQDSTLSDSGLTDLLQYYSIAQRLSMTLDLVRALFWIAYVHFAIDKSAQQCIKFLNLYFEYCERYSIRCDANEGEALLLMTKALIQESDVDAAYMFCQRAMHQSFSLDISREAINLKNIYFIEYANNDTVSTDSTMSFTIIDVPSTAPSMLRPSLSSPSLSIVQLTADIVDSEETSNNGLVFPYSMADSLDVSGDSTLHSVARSLPSAGSLTAWPLATMINSVGLTP